MEFLGKDKLARLDEERQRRRQQRADEALKRLEEIGKQTQQVARDQTGPGASDAKQDDQDPARRVGGLSRVLYETATGGQDLAGARQMRRIFKKKPELQAKARQAAGQIQDAMRTIQGAVANTAIAGLRDGLAGAAAQVNDAVSRVSSMAQGRIATNALHDLMKEEAQDAEAEQAQRAAAEKDPASAAAAASTEVAREEAPTAEEKHAGPGGLGGMFGRLRNTLQERAGNVRETIDQARATPGAIVNDVAGTPREMIDRVRTAPGAIVRDVKDLENAPRDLADQALAVPRQLGQQIASTPRELANDLVSAPRDAIERAANAPREIAQNLTDAPRHVVDSVRELGEHVANEPRFHFGAIAGGLDPRNAKERLEETARGLDPRNAIGEVKAGITNDVAGFRTTFDPRRIADDAAALDPHRLGERLAPHLDPRRIAEETASAADAHQILRDTAGGIVAGAMHDFVTRNGKLDQGQGDAEAPAAGAAAAAPGQAQAPAQNQTQNQAQPPSAAHAPAPAAASNAHAPQHKGVDVKKPDAKHEPKKALDHGHHHHVTHHDHKPGHVDLGAHHETHHAVVHPAPHSATHTQPHANVHGAALAPRGPEPGHHTPAVSRTPVHERSEAVRPTNIAPSASKAQVDIASHAPMNVQLQPVQSEEPRIDRKANPVSQPSFQITAKGNSGPLPNAPGEQPKAPQPAVAPPTQAAPPATQSATTTSSRHAAPLPAAPRTAPAGSNPALAAARGTAAGLKAPQGSVSPLPAGAAPAAGGTVAAPATVGAGAGGINTQAAAVPAPPAAQIPAGGGGGSAPAAPQTPTDVPAAPNIPEVHGGGGDSPPDPASLVQQTASLGADRSAAASTINAEAATQSRVAPAAQSQKASEVTPLGPVMSTTARSADAPMAAANSSATSQGQSETAAGRSSEQAEAASERSSIASQMSGANAQRSQYAAMPPPAILQQTSPSAMQPLATAAQSAVHAAGAAVAAMPAHLSPGAIAQGQHAAATNSTLPPFDAARFNQIDHRAPLPPLETSGVDAAHEAAGQTYQAAHQQVQQMSNIPAPQIQAPAGPVNAKTETGQPTREAAIARIEAEVSKQGQAQAPAQMRAAAAPVQSQATQHVSDQETQGRTQAQAQVAQAQQQVQEVSNRPPPVTGAQAAAQARPQYESHQAEATSAHNQMRAQIAQHQAQAEGQVQTARGQRNAEIATAQGQYGSTVQGQVMPQYAAAQNAAHAGFDASKNAASAQMATEQAQAHAEAQSQSDQARAKADSDISTHQQTLASQQQQAYASHQQQVAAADAQHQAQMQQAQSQMDSQVQQHQAQMQSQVASKQSEGQQQVNQHLTQGEQQYQQHIQQGTAQANAKKAEAEREAAAKKAQADAEKKKHHGGGIFGAICSFVSGLVNDLLNAVKSILKAACDAVVSIMQAARAAAVAALNAARQAALAALNAVKSAIQGIITACANAIKAVISACASLIKGLIQALASVLKSLVAALTTLLTTLVQAFKMAVDGILQGLSAALSVVDKVLGTHLHEAVDRFRQKFDTAMNKLKSDIETAGRALEAGIQKAADVACAAVDAAAKKLEQAVTTIEHALNAAVEAAYQLGAAAINKAFDLAEAAVNTAFDVAEAAVKAYVALQVAMISAAQKVVSKVAEFVTDLANKALEVVDKIAQAVVDMIPDSWVKAFVDFWNGPWRTMIIIGLATVAAVAITVATGGLGGPIAGVLLAGVIGGTLAGGAYFGGEMLAREGDIKLSNEGKGMYVPGIGYAQMGPDGKLIPPPGLSKDKLAQFEQQSQWAQSNFNLQYGPDGKVVGYDRKSGSEIGNYAVAEGIKGFGEGFVSSALAVAGGGAGSWVADSLNMAGGTLLRSAVEGTVANVITGPVQQGLTSAWDAGFEAIKDGKSPLDALKAAWGAGSSQLASPGNWASAMMMMGIGPAKLKFLTPALEGTMENVESRALKTVVSRGTDIAFDTMGQTFGQAGGNFIGAYYEAIKSGKSPAEALAAARQAADQSFDPANIASTLLMNTAGSISGPAHGGHQPIEGEYGTNELGRTRTPEEPTPGARDEHTTLQERERVAREQGGGAVDFPQPHTEAERISQAHTVERDATIQMDKVDQPPELPRFIEKVLGTEKGPRFEQVSRDLHEYYADQSREARQSVQVSTYRTDQMIDEHGNPRYNADGTPYGYGIPGRFEVSRYTNANGEHLTEITMKVHLDAGEGVTPADIARVQREAAEGVDHYYNSGHRLPNGDHLNVKVEFVDDPGAAHLNVQLGAGEGHANQTHWYTEGEEQSTVHAHELGHQLGFLDEYYDPESRFRSSGDSADIAHDGSLMGNFWETKKGLFGSKNVVREGTGIRERHLQQLHDDIQRARETHDLAEWNQLYSEGRAIAEGKGQYATMTTEERNAAVTEINKKITEVKASYEDAHAQVEAAAARPMNAAERARQTKLTGNDFSELRSQDTILKEQRATAERDARTEMKRLADERNDVEQGNGVWKFATEEQRKNQLKLIDDQLNQANDRLDAIRATAPSPEGKTPMERALELGFGDVGDPHPEASQFRLGPESDFHFKSSEEAKWPEQLRTTLSDQFGVDAGRVKVRRFGAGKSGDLVFGVWMDGESMGVLKVYRDPSGAAVDARIIHTMDAANLEHYQVAEDRGALGYVDIDGHQASSLYTELVPGRSIEDLIERVPPQGSDRMAYMDMLDQTMRSSAEMYADLHTGMASGAEMSRQRKINDANMILSKLDTIREKNNQRHFASPEQMAKIEHYLRDVVGPKFIESHLPATAFHGDAHVGNVQVDEHLNARPLDLTSMKWGLDGAGRGNGTGAVDVGQFVARLYEKSEGKLSIPEIQRLEKTFVDEYYKHSTVTEEEMRPAQQLYAVESQLARIQWDIGDPKGAMHAIEELLGMTGSSGEHAPAPSAEAPLVPGGWKYDRQWMSDAEVVAKGAGDKNGHANETIRVTLKGSDGRTVDGIFKPKAGEKPLRQNIESGTYYQRESLASALDDSLNLGLVPPTVERTIDGQVGSLQLFAEGAKGILGGGPVKFERADYEKFKVFDYIQGNSDRHNGNIMQRDVEGSPRPIAIDNGLGYPNGVNTWWRLDDNISKPSATPGEILPETREFLKSIDLDRVAKDCAAAGISPEATRNVLRRAMRAKDDPAFLLGNVSQVDQAGKVPDQGLSAEKLAQIDGMVDKAYNPNAEAAPAPSPHAPEAPAPSPEGEPHETPHTAPKETLEAVMAEQGYSIDDLKNDQWKLQAAANQLLKAKGIDNPSQSQLAKTKFELDKAIKSGSYKDFEAPFGGEMIHAEDGVRERLGNIFYEKELFRPEELTADNLKLNDWQRERFETNGFESGMSGNVMAASFINSRHRSEGDFSHAYGAEAWKGFVKAEAYLDSIPKGKFVESLNVETMMEVNRLMWTPDTGFKAKLLRLAAFFGRGGRWDHGGELRDGRQFARPEDYTKDQIANLREAGIKVKQFTHDSEGGGKAMLEYPKPEEVRPTLEKLVAELRDDLAQPGADPIMAAAKFQRKFVALHPFGDSNGRTSRILMNRILADYDMTPAIFADQNHDIDLSPQEWRDEVAKGVARSKKYIESASINSKDNYLQELGIAGPGPGEKPVRIEGLPFHLGADGLLYDPTGRPYMVHDHELVPMSQMEHYLFARRIAALRFRDDVNPQAGPSAGNQIASEHLKAITEPTVKLYDGLVADPNAAKDITVRDDVRARQGDARYSVDPSREMAKVLTDLSDFSHLDPKRLFAMSGGRSETASVMSKHAQLDLELWELEQGLRNTKQKAQLKQVHEARAKLFEMARSEMLSHRDETRVSPENPEGFKYRYEKLMYDTSPLRFKSLDAAIKAEGDNKMTVWRGDYAFAKLIGMAPNNDIRQPDALRIASDREKQGQVTNLYDDLYRLEGNAVGRQYICTTSDLSLLVGAFANSTNSRPANISALPKPLRDRLLNWIEADPNMKPEDRAALRKAAEDRGASFLPMEQGGKEIRDLFGVPGTLVTLKIVDKATGKIQITANRKAFRLILKKEGLLPGIYALGGPRFESEQEIHGLKNIRPWQIKEAYGADKLNEEFPVIEKEKPPEHGPGGNGAATTHPDGANPMEGATPEEILDGLKPPEGAPPAPPSTAPETANGEHAPAPTAENEHANAPAPSPGERQRWDGQEPRAGEMWSFQSKSGNFYRGVFRGYDQAGHVVLDTAAGSQLLNPERLVTARPGVSAPELHQYGPNEPVTLYSVRGNPHTGVIAGYDEKGNVLLRTPNGVEQLRLDQLDLSRTQRVAAGPQDRAPEHEAGSIVHFGADAEKHIALATKLGVMPDVAIHVSNAIYKVGHPFDIGQGRMGVLMEVEVDGKRYMRVAYRSNSQGGFRLLPARNKGVPMMPGYDKGIGEHAIMLPNAVDELLMKRVAEGQVRDVPPDQAEAVFEGGVPVNRSLLDYMKYSESADHVSKSVKTYTILAEAKDMLPTASGHDLPAPGQVHISNPALRPNFAKPVRTYHTTTSVAGPVEALVYRSHNGALEYVVYKDQQDHVWFKSVSVVDAKITAQGVSDTAIDAGALTTPYWEYRQQVPAEMLGQANAHHAEYSSSWKYLQGMEEIRAWYKATGTTMPLQ